MPPRVSTQRLLSSTACPRTCSIASTSRTPPASRSPFSTGPTATRQSAARAHRSTYGAIHQRDFHSSSARGASSKDPYNVLGVSQSASASEIKKKYYELARKHHPDTNKDPKAKDRFVEIQAAWDTLGDEKKRAQYDQYGAASQQAGFDPNAFSSQGNPFGAGGFGFQGFSQGFGGAEGSAGDLFSSLFGGGGGGGRPAGPRRGEDVEAAVNISFIDACKGTVRTVKTNPVVDCKPCTGSGLKKGAKRTTCKACGGTGSRTFVIQSGFQMASTCNVCQGAGSTVPKESECGSCGGIGKVKDRKDVQVPIPAGVEDRMHIRVPGEGDAPISGKGSSGDLLVRVNVAPSNVFRRQGTNLYHDARIPLHTALLGGKVRVPTLDGEVDVRVPSGTQHGEEAVLKGRGVTSVHGYSKGDLYVAFGVQIPRSLTARQREIMQLFADDLEGRPTAKTSASTNPDPDPPTSSSTSTSNESESGATKPQKAAATG